jgi:small subunit ribosomal protein S14
MAKESMKAKQRKKIKMAAKYADKRAELRKAANEGDWDAMMALQRLPKNSMQIRVHNRCQLTGRPKGYIRQFGISRVTFREMALNGKIPGVTKASW